MLIDAVVAALLMQRTSSVTRECEVTEDQCLIDPAAERNLMEALEQVRPTGCYVNGQPVAHNPLAAVAGLKAGAQLLSERLRGKDIGQQGEEMAACRRRLAGVYVYLAAAFRQFQCITMAKAREEYTLGERVCEAAFEDLADDAYEKAVLADADQADKTKDLLSDVFGHYGRDAVPAIVERARRKRAEQEREIASAVEQCLSDKAKEIESERQKGKGIAEALDQCLLKFKEAEATLQQRTAELEALKRSSSERETAGPLVLAVGVFRSVANLHSRVGPVGGVSVFGGVRVVKGLSLGLGQGGGINGGLAVGPVVRLEPDWNAPLFRLGLMVGYGWRLPTNRQRPERRLDGLAIGLDWRFRGRGPKASGSREPK